MKTSSMRLNTAGLSSRWSAIAVVGGLAAANVAYSQETSASAGPDDTLQEIVVTAEHRETNLQKTAVAVNVLPAAELQAQGQNSFDDALRTVPSVAVRDDSGGPTVVIRGIEPAFSTDPTVNINVDGVYQANPGAIATFDLQRVEILKGPQGTLFGRNANAGVVNFITNSPGRNFGGSALVQYGSYDAARMESAVNLPFGDVIQTRTAALYSSHSGYLSNGAEDEDTRAVREKVLIKPTGELSILLTGEYDHFGGNGVGNVPAPLSSHSDNPWQTDVDPGAQDWTNKSANLEIDWNLSWTRIFAQAADQSFVNRSDNDLQTPSSGFTNGATEHRNTSYELRLSSLPGSIVIWQAGLYHLEDKSKAEPFPADLLPLEPHPLGNTITGSLATTRSNAIFGQATYPVTETFRLTGGLRYTRDDKTLVTDDYLTATKALLNAYRNDASFGSTTFKFGVENDLTPTSMLYADVSKGFKAGGLNAPGSDPISYAPETVLAYELGSKNELLDRTLRLNVDAYYYDYSDKQTVIVGPCNPAAVPSTCPFPSTVTVNAAKATIYGAEMQLEWAPTRADQLSFGAAYNHTRYGTLTFSELNVVPQQFGPPLFVVQSIDRSGTQLPNAPLWTETVSYAHTFSLASSKLTAGANVLFASGDDSDPNFNQLDQYQHAYDLVGASLRYAPVNANWSIGAYGNNLTNEAVRQRSFINNRLWLMPPRTYGVNANISF